MDVRTLLKAVEDGSLTSEEALVHLKEQPFTDLGFAKVDHHRAVRQGAAEVVYGASKTPEQILAICQSLREGGAACVLVTRLDATAAAWLEERMELAYHSQARIGVAGRLPEPDGNGTVVVACAGTSDLPVAEEAALTAQALGNQVTRLYDVGVSGLHRVLAHLDDLVNAQVVIAIAGMEGALASVIGGLTAAPVIAVPTSVGYGAAFGGVAALLGMLTSCASGVSVVNIDNGFGAAFQAHQINHLRIPASEAAGAAESADAADVAGAADAADAADTAGAADAAGTAVTAPATGVPAAEAAPSKEPAQASADEAPACSAGQAEGAQDRPGQPTELFLDLSASATRGSLLDQLLAAMDDAQRAQHARIVEAAHVTDRHHHDHAEVAQTIAALDVPAGVRAALNGVYAILAQAESTVHGTPVEHTHFHEVGNGSAIANALSICAAFHVLGTDGAAGDVQGEAVEAVMQAAKTASPGSGSRALEQAAEAAAQAFQADASAAPAKTLVQATPVQTGCGTVECAHGVMDIPAPATAAIIEAHGIPVQAEKREGELCTPTSAALIAHFVDGYVFKDAGSLRSWLFA